MTYKINIFPQADEDLTWFRQNDKTSYTKCFDLVRDVAKNPRQGLGKPERLRYEELPETLVGAMANWLKSPFVNFRQLRKLGHFEQNGHEADDIIYALKDVSFEVKRGEVVGIIGAMGLVKVPCSKFCLRFLSRPLVG